MPEGMRTDSLVRKRGACALGLDHVFAEDVSKTKAREGRSVGVEKDLLATRIPGNTFLEISAQAFGRFHPQRATALFSTFAQQFHLGHVVKPQVAPFQVDDLTRPCPRVIEQ